MSDVKKWNHWKIVLVSVVVFNGLLALFFLMRGAGVVGSTIIEREVFERSYQRSEALKSQIATDEAVLAEIQYQLSNPNLDVDTRHNLEAQASAARVRIATARGKR